MKKDTDYGAAVRMFRIVQDANNALKSRKPAEIAAVQKKIAMFDKDLMNGVAGNAFPQQAISLDFVATVFIDALSKKNTCLDKKAVLEAIGDEMPQVLSVAALVRASISLSSETAQTMAALGFGQETSDEETDLAA